MNTPIIEEVRARIAAERDVQRVLEIAPDDKRFRYLVQTPFDTWPRYVIGTTDAALSDVRIEFRCGEECFAREKWNAFVSGAAALGGEVRPGLDRTPALDTPSLPGDPVPLPDWYDGGRGL
jgi:hypothetical protein